MTLSQIVGALDLERLTPADAERERVVVESAHASDLLSDVLANAPRGGVVLTIQAHLNVVAVALNADQAAVIFTSGFVPDQGVRDRAAAEGMPLYATRLSTFDVSGRLYELGLRGRAPRGQDPRGEHG